MTTQQSVITSGANEAPTLLQTMREANAVKVVLYHYVSGNEQWLKAFDKDGNEVLSQILHHNGYSSNQKVETMEEAICIINENSPLSPKTPGIFYEMPHLTVNEIIQLNLPVNAAFMLLPWEIVMPDSTNRSQSVTITI